ncbi:MAG: LON peptidase substrate-binding domain-containing protein [Acidobacteriota bacterium]
MTVTSTDLPSILPIFPLTGVLLLPGGKLPLYIFEPRYCSMVGDALADHRCIGIVQPFEPDPADGRGEGKGAGDGGEEQPGDSPEVYPVGCVGRIEHFEQLPHGRFVLLLEGVGRFRARRELELLRGYRRVEADYGEFGVDAEDRRADLEAEPLLEALRSFGLNHRVTIELDQLEDISGLDLLNSVAMALPFAPAEKQALLEAADLKHRQELLLMLLDMGLELQSDGDGGPAPN